MDIQSIVKQLTLEEKCSMLSGKSFWESRDIERLGVPAIFLADGPHGIRKQAGAADHLGLNESYKATCFPTAATMANSFNTELGEEVGKALGVEAVCQKVNVLLGPGLNIKRNPLCGRNFEYFSEDPYLAGKMSAAYVRGIQASGIAACLKHYAANNQEHRRMVVDTIVDERTLREIYLTNFEIGVKEGKSKTIMSAYNKVNGYYANESEHLLADVLRKDWGFDGVIVSDWGGQNDRVAAVKAGMELEMPSSGGETSKEVLAAVQSGALDEKLVDECVIRLLELVVDTEKPFAGRNPDEVTPFDVDAHHALALKAAEDSIVLLKNDANALPLKSGERVAVVGDFARRSRFQGAGSSGVNPTKIDATLDSIGQCGITYVGFEAGFERFGEKSGGLLKKAVSLAQTADTVLAYIGLDEKTETEGADRKDMRLPQNQRDLLKALKATGKKVIAVIAAGAAIEVDFDDDCNAILHGYLGGQAGAGAMLNVLTGKVSPSGKLAETYPVVYTDCPSATNFPGVYRNVEYREGIFVGYRYYETAGERVKYPFGYGLSYTNFTYSDIKIDEKGVSFMIENTGDTAGAEAAQLYIGLKDSKIFRANKELKGFAKVYLEAGERKKAVIPFDEYSFRYFNVATNKWETEAGEYDIYVGASSADIRLSGKISKKGTTDVFPYDLSKMPSYASGKAGNVSPKEFELLYGKEVPDSRYPFYRPGRLWADHNTGISELRFARGWLGRFFAWVAKKFFILGMDQMPLRGLVRFGGAMSHGQLDGLIRVFNGSPRSVIYSPLIVCMIGLIPFTLGLGAIPILLLAAPWLLWDLRKFLKEMKLRGLESKLANLEKNGKFEFEIWKAEQKIKQLKNVIPKGLAKELRILKKQDEKKFAAQIAKLEQQITAISNERKQKNAPLIAALENQITEWKKTPATKEQLAETQARIDKVKAKIAKIDAGYAKYKAKFDARVEKRAKRKAKR
ncbi:MAG: glycoside hydrolase family 3 C-terminal domain-containing protein [Firmicutes bacterium]|nr:glycoside hydrolase family 3 C-terminal domain-containing protein [Bacillota bacterium]